MTDSELPEPEPASEAVPWSSPEWFPITIAPEENRLTLVPVSEQLLRQAGFLDAREIPLEGRREVTIEAASRGLSALELPLKPLHGVFHIAFCGSTLLARCLERLRATLVLKEPFEIGRASCRERV